MDPSYSQVYADLYRRHWWWRAREELLVEVIREISNGRHDLRILDIGCGSGLFFDRLREFGSVRGVELDRALAEAEPRHRDLIHVGDLSTLPADRPFDLILLLDVLEHLDDPQDVLARALSMLAPEGRIVVTVPAFMGLWTHHDHLNQHVTRYTRARLTRLVRGAGGRVSRSDYFFRWTVPAKLGVRMVERIRGPGGPERVPSPAVNRLLYALSRFEQRVIGSSRLPFGTSLLAIIARRSAGAAPMSP